MRTGEIFDRTIDLIVRNFWTFAPIALSYGIPYAVAMYVPFAGGPDFFQVALFAHGPHHAQTAHANHELTVYTFLLIFVVMLFQAALIVATSTTYLGGRAGLGGSYRIVFRRISGIIGVIASLALAYLAIFVVAFVPAGVTYVVAFLIQGNQLATVLAIGVLFVLFLGLLTLATLVAQMSFRAVLFENSGVRAAISRSCMRLTSRAIRVRSVLVAFELVSLTIITIALQISGRHLLLFMVLHSQTATVLWYCTITVVSDTICAALLTVFYYDVRVRTEALDLTLLSAIDRDLAVMPTR